ncbi:hypothetical protein BG842_18340 [Haladaptatus sp. W1]|nr:hypothetical protein BG842_18340 [Haladaptatus sp. W1]
MIHPDRIRVIIMTIATQSRPMRSVLFESGVSAVGISAWKGRYGSPKGNRSRGRDGWYGVTDGHLRSTPTLVA